MAYSPNVERWRPIVERYFRPEDVDKALYVINGESGGNPTIAGDNGASIGLFQMNRSGGLGTGSSVEQLQDPEYNIKLAAQAVYGGSGWKPWGEGALYNGQPFGALGNNPYGGQAAGGSMAYEDWFSQYAPIYTRWKSLDAKIQPYVGTEQVSHFDPQRGLIVLIPSGSDAYGEATYEEAVAMTPDEYNEWAALDGELSSLEDSYERSFGGDSLAEAIKRAEFSYDTDPRNIDANNAADRFARELDIRAAALDLVSQGRQAQTDQVDQALESQAAWAASRGQRVTGEPAAPTSALIATPAKLFTPDELFDKAVAKLQGSLPNVPDRPYFSGSLPSDAPSIGEARANASVFGGGLPSAAPRSRTLGGVDMDFGLQQRTPPPAAEFTPGNPFQVGGQTSGAYSLIGGSQSLPQRPVGQQTQAGRITGSILDMINRPQEAVRGLFR